MICVSLDIPSCKFYLTILLDEIVMRKLERLKYSTLDHILLQNSKGRVAGRLRERVKVRVRTGGEGEI